MSLKATNQFGSIFESDLSQGHDKFGPDLQNIESVAGHKAIILGTIECLKSVLGRVEGFCDVGGSGLSSYLDP